MFSVNSKFYLVKRQNGYYYISIVYRDEINKRRYKYISTHTKLKSDANKFLSNLKAEQSKQSSIRNQIYKLSDVKNQILHYIKINRSNGSYCKYEITFRYLIKILNDKYVSLITFSDIEFFKSELLKRGIRETSVNSYLRTAKSVFSLFFKLGITTENKIRFVKQFNIPERKILSFSNAELILIEENSDANFRNMIRFSYMTGVRISEMINIQLKDIEDGVINILNKKNFTTKSQKQRKIPINSEIQKLINDILGNLNTNVLTLRNPESYLFNNKGVKLDRRSISKKFKNLLKKIEMDSFHWHNLRATFIMRLVRKNINPLIIKDLCGHSCLAVLESYTSSQFHDLKSAMDA